MAARRRWQSAILLIGVLELAGCTPPDQTVLVPAPVGPACDFTPMLQGARSGPALLPATPGAMEPIPLDSARIIDRSISNKVQVQAVARGRTAAGATELYARLVNCTDYPQQVQVRAHFLDASQIPTEPPSVWRRVFLQPKSIADYREAGTRPAVPGHFLLEVREAQ